MDLLHHRVNLLRVSPISTRIFNQHPSLKLKKCLRMSHHHWRSRPESGIRHGARVAVIRERRLNRQRARQHTENLRRLEEQRINSVDSEEEVITSHHFDHSFMNDRLLGLGHDELFPGRVKDLKETEFFKSLGSTEKERCEYLKDLTRERREWRPIYFKCLQLALRDVRAYKYDTATKKWIKHNRQSKRSGADLEEGDAPPTRRKTDKNDYYEAETL
ncbi:unnamed protein product [Cylicocyclus nassatus]|uniref:Uncharacterized protein n=1 Tax=Cylicocyclus nassatus TaxID=53992 RepID=A0AA36GGI7_CYLNA|nr:unnamed protein product [Cylicocyclus nassatus]